MTKHCFICDGVRTPIGKFGGALSSIRPDDLAALTFSELQKRNPMLNLEKIEDVILGNANQAGEDNRNIARMASLLAQFPVTVPGMTINRLCGSGMDAVLQASRAIQCGQAHLMIAGGVESMSRAPFVLPKATTAFSRHAEIYDTTIGWRFINSKMQQLYGTDSMPETAENVAKEFNISRNDQDNFALLSQIKYQNALSHHFFDDEIMPVSYTIGKKGSLICNRDEHPRAHSSIESLNKLSPLLGQGCTVTAGNSSGINDGACAIIVADEDAIKEHHLSPAARIIGGLSVGVPPRIMGIGPAYAGKQLLQKYNLNFDDLDVIELNEAFAAQALATTRFWNLSDTDTRINPNGGAIALGHPLGMSGARLILTATRQLKKIKGQYALCTMCIGVGQGIAILLEQV